MTLRAAWLLAALAALTPACLSTTPPGVLLASQPRGARVWVDGRDSGWVTPCFLDLDREREHEVTLELAGHGPARVQLVPSTTLTLVDWQQGLNSTKNTLHFPTMLPSDDLMIPLRLSQPLSPQRFFVRLRPTGTP